MTDNRKISKEKGEELAEEYKIPFFEASAKSGENVDEVFKALYKKMKMKQFQKNIKKILIKLNQ